MMMDLRPQYTTHEKHFVMVNFKRDFILIVRNQCVCHYSNNTLHTYSARFSRESYGSLEDYQTFFAVHFQLQLRHLFQLNRRHFIVAVAEASATAAL